MFCGWLRVVARTALSDCRRRRFSFWDMLRRRADEPDVDENPGREGDKLRGAIDTGLAALTAGDRALLEAKYFQGESVRAIAERMNVSPKAVESRLTRARAELRRQLKEILTRHE
jgi:RNA polymerase sigma-70 factor (ECF subfamily)